MPPAAFLAVDTSSCTRRPRVAGGSDGVGCSGSGTVSQEGTTRGTPPPLALLPMRIAGCAGGWPQHTPHLGMQTLPGSQALSPPSSGLIGQDTGICFLATRITGTLCVPNVLFQSRSPRVQSGPLTENLVP